MAISSMQETLLMYTKQKSMINEKISNIQFNLLSASREAKELQDKYNQKEQYYYYQYYGQDDLRDEYQEICEQLLKEHEFDLANINSWEQELEKEKNNYETRLNEITQYEASWQKLLATNIKSDFSYGGVQQG